MYINKTMDERYPLMVRAVYEGGQIQMMIMLWGLSWEKMTLGQANFLYRCQLSDPKCGAAFPEIYAGTGRKALYAGVKAS